MTQEDTTPAVPSIGFVDPDDAFTRRFVEQPFFEKHLERIDTYDLPKVDLRSFSGIVVSSQLDQDFLYHHRRRIRTYLDMGGVVAFSGHLSRQWLPGVGCFQPKSVESHDDYAVIEATPHPVFEGVEMDDLTYHRDVAGFFARGHNPPPDHATVLLRLEDGEPIVYVDEESTEGTMFVHSGNDLIGFGRRSSTAARVPDQLLAWIRTKSTVKTVETTRNANGVDQP